MPKSTPQKMMEKQLLRRAINMLDHLIMEKKYGMGLINYNIPEMMAQEVRQSAKPRRVDNRIGPVPPNLNQPRFTTMPVPVYNRPLTQGNILHQARPAPLEPHPSQPGFFEDPHLYKDLQDYLKRDEELRRQAKPFEEPLKPGPYQILVKGKKKKGKRELNVPHFEEKMMRGYPQVEQMSDAEALAFEKEIVGSSFQPLQSILELIKSEAESQYVTPLHQKFAREEAERIPFRDFPEAEMRMVEKYPKPYSQRVAGKEYYNNFPGSPEFQSGQYLSGFPKRSSSSSQKNLTQDAFKKKRVPVSFGKLSMRHRQRPAGTIPPLLEREMMAKIPYQPTHDPAKYLGPLPKYQPMRLTNGPGNVAKKLNEQVRKEFKQRHGYLPGKMPKGKMDMKGVDESPKRKRGRPKKK